MRASVAGVYLHVVDVQGRLFLPKQLFGGGWFGDGQMYSMSSGPSYSLRGQLCVAATPLGVSKPCILFFQDGREEVSIPDGIEFMTRFGRTSKPAYSLYYDGRVRLSKHDINHLFGRDKLAGRSKKDRTLMLIDWNSFFIATSLDVWV